MKHPYLLLAVSFFLAVLTPRVTAENWSAWRGPRGDGTSLETRALTEWTATRNIAWETAVTGAGHSSPIVWEDRIFTAAAMPEKMKGSVPESSSHG